MTSSIMKEFEHLEIQLENIKSATNNFDKTKKIGSGGFGDVYEAEISHFKGRSKVAIKRLIRRYGQGNAEFLKEIATLSRCKHKNLITLLGFCDKDGEKILVYEHAARGSLDHLLSSTNLTWTRRIKICLDAARGLSYLHDPRETHQRVIHRDIKSSNILLDGDWNAKVSDMGLSKIGPANQQYTALFTNVVGTPGYCDPRYLETYTLTKESDIYSFGVVMFEVLCGRLCYQISNGQLQVLVSEWKQSYQEKKLDAIIFQGLVQPMDPIALETFSGIAFQCLEKSRPTMALVVEKLEIALKFQEPHDLTMQNEEITPLTDYSSIGPEKLHSKGKSKIDLMTQEISITEMGSRKQPLLKDQVCLVKRKDSDRYEIAGIQGKLAFEKGYFIVIRACLLLAQKNEGIILVGLAGPSGAGKTLFTEKILNFMPNVAVISMENYNDGSRLIDDNFDDPRLTDYDTLLKNIYDLKEGKTVEVPIYDFKSSTRTGYMTLEVPSSRIVIIEGIYALSEKLHPLLDLRVSVSVSVHFDLVRRVLRDTQRVGKEPEEIIYQISETAYPMYKAFIEPDLKTAHISIVNKSNPFTGVESPTYILKSSRYVTVDQVKSVMSDEHTGTADETHDIYLLPPGEDPEACQSYLRMRNRVGRYGLMFEEWVTDSPFIVSQRLTFEVSLRLLGDLMALGYTIACILKRSSHVFSDDRVCVKMDWLERMNQHYVQVPHLFSLSVSFLFLNFEIDSRWPSISICDEKVQGRDRRTVKYVAEQLGLEGSYIPRTYIEQMQLEKLVKEVMVLPDELKTKLSLEDEMLSRKEAFPLRRNKEKLPLRGPN